MTHSLPRLYAEQQSNVMKLVHSWAQIAGGGQPKRAPLQNLEWDADVNLSPDIKKIPLKIHQNTPFQVKKNLFFWRGAFSRPKIYADAVNLFTVSTCFSMLLVFGSLHTTVHHTFPGLLFPVVTVNFDLLT